MRKQIGKLIPLATAAIRAKLALEENSKQVNEAYSGYAASYGAAIDQSGLLAATAMFSDQSKRSKTKGDKTCLMDAILDVLKHQDPSISEGSLFDYVQANLAMEYLLKRQILDSSIALKLVLRTFEQVKPKRHES